MDREGIRIGVLISGGGTNLQAILDACASGGIEGRVVFVGADTVKAKGLDRARRLGIPTFVVDYGQIIQGFDAGPRPWGVPTDFRIEEVLAKQALFKDRGHKAQRFFTTRAVAEAALLENMAAYPMDLLALAGFMRNLTPYFIDRVNTNPSLPRIMNIHPALLPSFPGTDGYGDTYRYGCKVGGCTVHFIDYGEDSGPIIGQKCFPIGPADSLESVKEKGLRLEWELYPQCIRLYAGGRLKVVSRQWKMPDGTPFRRSVVEIALA